MALDLSSTRFAVPNTTAFAEVISFDDDPTSGSGVQAELGSLCLRTDSGSVYVKTGSSAIAWSLLGTTTGSGPASGLTGDGSDGNVSVAALSTLSLMQDMFYATLNVAATGTVLTNGYRVFVNGTLTLNGTITNNGVAGGTGGSGGTGAPGGYLAAGASGGTGGAAGGDGSNGLSSTEAARGSGLGGDGGNGAGTTRGSGGGFASGTPDPKHGDIHEVMQALSGTSNRNIQFTPGAGGGGGGGSSSPAASGGHGGGGGGYVVVAAHEIVGSGSIQAMGGDGGPGGVGGNAGGGGGGAGGIVVVLVETGTTPTINVQGGAKGLKSGTGSDGSPGNNGVTVVYKLS